VEEEQSVRHRHGGSRYNIKADVEEEWAPVGVWQENELLQGLGFRGATHLKRRIVAMGGVDYVSTPVAKAE
jgi:hypothetical protein